MNKEKTAFSLSSGSLFVPVKPPSFTFSQLQSTFDPSKVPPEKPRNCASQIVKALTSNLIPTFNKCNPKFHYDPSSNPKRCLTAPAEGVYNNGYDNINNEYILYVNDVIRSPENEEYLILELLGKGTFGQVIRCIRKPSNEQFAVKVIKNKPAYTNQALTEVKIYKGLKEEALSNEDHIVRLFDYFVFRNHICLIFELLHISLYDLLRLSNFSGFSLKFIGRLTEQIIESMVCLERNKIIHCDLKPENVLFADEESDGIKVIDLGSSCFLHSTVYTYIQSRFYRAPEVILGSKYTNKIDSWSLGCMVAEFYLGLPLFPGNSEYDQLKRIIDILGMFEDEVIENGRFKSKFFKRENNTFVFKSTEEFEQEQNIKLQPHKKYFLLKKLEDLEMYYNKSKQREKQPQEKQRFEIFVHFLKGLLQVNPAKRWTASQAKFHPFLTGTPFEPNWEPLSQQEALEEARKLVNRPEEAGTSNPFHKPTIEVLNAESYRPIIADKKEEANQNVYLLNSQTSSTKPKSKLNAKAANFNTGSFQVPALNLDPQTTNFNPNAKPKGSQSEPNSARNSFRKHGKDANEVQFTYQEEKEEDNIDAQEGEQNADKTNKTGPTGPSGQKGFKKNQNQQYQGKGGSKDTNNVSNNQQFYPSGQYGNYQGGGYQPRQRSNSDQGSSETIFFQQNKGKQHQQYQQYPPQQYQQYPPQQFPPPPQQYQQYPPQQFQQYPPQQYQQYQQFPPQQFQQNPQQYQQYQQQYPQYQGNNQFQNHTNNQYGQFQGTGHQDQGYTNQGNQPKHGKKWSGSQGKGSGYKNKYGNNNNNSSQYDEKEELKEK